MRLATVSLSLLLLALVPPSLAGRCGDHCAFRFCAANGIGFLRRKCTLVTVRPPRVALGAYICNPDRPALTRVLTTGEAEIALDDNFGPDGVEPSPEPLIPISKWRPAGLSPPFAKRFFTAIPIIFQTPLTGLARRKARGNQNDYLSDRCLVLPINSWEENVNGVATVVQGGAPEDCVAFETSYPKVFVELIWDGADTLDLSLMEPDGTVIDKDNGRGESGGRLSDNKMQACNVAPAGFKSVLYDWRQRRMIQNGLYKISVRHTSNCGAGRTKWRLNVYIDDAKILSRRGRSDRDGGDLIVEDTFTLAF